METLLSERPARLLTVGARVTPAERQALEFEAQRRGFRNISDFTRAALGAFLAADSTPTRGEVLPCQMNLDKFRSAIQTADRLSTPVQTGGAQPYTDLTTVDEPMILMTAEQAEELLDLATAAVALAQQQAGALTRLQATVARLEKRR